MKDVFKLSRIKLEEMKRDAFDYLTSVYQQSGKVFTPASPYGQLLTVLLNLAQLVFFYIEDSVTEGFMSTASRPQSIRAIAALAGHNPTRAIAAHGELRLMYNGVDPGVVVSQLRIPQFTRLTCKNNSLNYIIYLPEEEIRMELGFRSEVVCKVVQGDVESQEFESDGSPLQSFEVNMRGGKMIDHFLVNVKVNGTTHEVFDSLYDIPKDYPGCLVRTGMTSGIDIFFGNGSFGAVPPPGARISVQYLVTQGSAGNIRESDQTAWEFLDPGLNREGESVDLNAIMDVTVAHPIGFGSSEEPTALTRLIAPMTSRSFVLARPENFVTFLKKFNQYSFIDAWTNDDTGYILDSSVVHIFLVPDISKRLGPTDNYFTVPMEHFTLTDEEVAKVVRLIDDSGQKILTSVINVVEPVVKRYVVNVSLVIFDGHSRELIRQQVVSKLSDYFIRVKYLDHIPQSDLVNIIEDIPGIHAVNVTFVSEENEAAKAAEVAAGATEFSADIGIDKFGDIVTAKGELPVFRGGWKDRYGHAYVDGVGPDEPGSVNVEIRNILTKTANARQHRVEVQNIKRS